MKLDRRQWIKGAALAGVGLTAHYLTTKKAGAAAPAARKGMALTIGLNRVDPQHYSGWSGPLKACEFDAEDMCEIARGEGYECTTLLTSKATRDAAIGEITSATNHNQWPMPSRSYLIYHDFLAPSLRKLPRL